MSAIPPCGAGQNYVDQEATQTLNNVAERLGKTIDKLEAWTSPNSGPLYTIETTLKKTAEINKENLTKVSELRVDMAETYTEVQDLRFEPGKAPTAGAAQTPKKTWRSAIGNFFSRISTAIKTAANWITSLLFKRQH